MKVKNLTKEFEKLSDKEKIIVAALANGTENLVKIAKNITKPTVTVSRYLPNLIGGRFERSNPLRV